MGDEGEKLKGDSFKRPMSLQLQGSYWRGRSIKPRRWIGRTEPMEIGQWPRNGNRTHSHSRLAFWQGPHDSVDSPEQFEHRFESLVQGGRCKFPIVQRRRESTLLRRRAFRETVPGRYTENPTSHTRTINLPTIRDHHHIATHLDVENLCKRYPVPHIPAIPMEHDNRWPSGGILDL